jgi:hypothetical protein
VAPEPSASGCLKQRLWLNKLCAAKHEVYRDQTCAMNYNHPIEVGINYRNLMIIAAELQTNATRGVDSEIYLTVIRSQQALETVVATKDIL